MHIELTYLQMYLLGVNIFIFLLCCIFKLIKGYVPFNIFFQLLILCGGVIGSLLYILLFEWKTKKENIYLKIFTICIFFIEALVIYIYRKPMTTYNIPDFNQLLIQYKYVFYYLIGINLITLLFYGFDKYQAIKQKSRIRITFLILLVVIGGGMGAMIGIYGFHHKTNKKYFTSGVPLIMFTELLFITYYLLTH